MKYVFFFKQKEKEQYIDYYCFNLNIFLFYFPKCDRGFPFFVPKRLYFNL